MRSTARVNDVAFNTVLKFNVDIGKACLAYQESVFKDLPIKYIECDEIWAFVGTKEERKKEDQPDGWGSAYTWTSIDPVTRLMPVWHVGGRTYADAHTFIQKIGWVVKDQGTNLQICTDGNVTYKPAIAEVFGSCVDYIQFHKIFFNEKENQAYRRYSMSRMKAADRKVVFGKPDMAMSTNHVERSNLTMRSGIKRFARMSSAFSKKLENLRLSVAMQMMHYNFCRIHSSIRCTPAMEAGLTDHVWDHREVVQLMEPAKSDTAAA